MEKMSFLSRIKQKIFPVSPPLAPKPTPAYCTPTKYDVGLAKGVLLSHTGLNRHQRCELAVLHDKCTPSRRFPTRKSVRELLKTSPSNFPIRAIYLDGKKTYLFEPEYWDLVAKLKVFEAEQKLQPKTDHVDGVGPSIPHTPSLSPEYA